MKLSHLLLAGVLTISLAPAVHAQTVFRPRAPLDSAQSAVRDAVLVLRDSLQVVHDGVARMHRDFRGASLAALVSRARSMRDGCAASTRTLPATRAVIASGPAATDKQRSTRERLLAEMDSLSAALAECQKTFGAWVDEEDGESVRGYGNRAAGTVRTAILGYEDRLQLYLRLIGIRIQPLGAGASVIRS